MQATAIEFDLPVEYTCVMTRHARSGSLEEQVITYSSERRLELWVRSSGILDGFDVYLGGTLMAGSDDNRTQVFPIERRTELMAILVRFRGHRGGSSALVDVTSDIRKIQERDDHCYLVLAV